MNAAGAATLRNHSGWNAAVSNADQPASPPAPRNWEPRRRRGLWPTWLLSAVLHAGLIVAWLNQAGPSVPRQVPRMEVRIVPSPLTPPRAAAPAAQAQPPQGQAADLSPLRKPAARASQPAAITPQRKPEPGDSPLPQLPSPDAAAIGDRQPSPSSTLQEPPSAAPASPGKSTLRLDWTPPSRPAQPSSTPSVREQALNDARANTQGLRAEARMAQAVGDDRLQEEALGDGRRRIRKGTVCADVHRTHIAQLNPFDSRLRDLNVAKACE
jgi:hypothetical protein